MPTSAAGKRMPKAARRAQLLEVALEIIREEGGEALTLARLAERAGVTKPIAYEHFGTRTGLLIALFRAHDEQTSAAVAQALAAGGRSAEDVARILSAAYVDCVLTIGPEFGAILDALSASEEASGFRDQWRESLSHEFREAFAPFVKLPARTMKAAVLGMLGAAEVLADSVVQGRMRRDDAVDALTRIFAGAVGK